VSGTVTTYDLADGIGTMEFNRGARLRTRDGRLVFGGATGVVGFDPEAIRPDERRPEIALVGVEAASRAGVRRLDGRGLEGVVLSPRERTATFTLAALAFEDPGQSRYAYRLDGLDEGWVEAGTERRARYTGLPPGDYVFRARAANHDGTWSEAVLAVPVRVEPWMWETTWFRVLVVVLLLGLGALAYRARVARLLAVERLRLRIAGDLHDDLSSDLSGIALATDLLGRRPGLAAADRQRLADVHSTATSMVDALRDIVWTVDPAHDSVEAFARRVRLVADRLLDGRAHAVEVDLPDAGALPMPLRRELLLILKEALHNAHRHAEAGRVDVRLGRDGADLVLAVEDDGVGFDPGAVAGGHGLRSLRTRAERIGGALTVDSTPGRGTRVRLAVPLPRNREARARRWSVPWRRRPATP
jgi:signal transduction histidine kinase